MSGSRGVPYFYNHQTKQSSWELPAGLTNEQVQDLPGAAEYLGSTTGGRPARVRASHLLVKHSGSRRPSSWKEVRLASYLLLTISDDILAKNYPLQGGGDCHA